MWWPSLWAQLSPDQQRARLTAYLTADRLPHRGDELSPTHWAHATQVLPGLRALAGTFADQSGPNCLGTVLAAFGVPGAAELWLHQGPFERWLDAHTVHLETNVLDALGQVLLWRDGEGQLQHAGVALGDGWLFHKEAQHWAAPRQVVRLEDALPRWAEPGWTVTARQLRPDAAPLRS